MLLGVRKPPENESSVLWAGAMGISAESLVWLGLLKPRLAVLWPASVYCVVSVLTSKGASRTGSHHFPGHLVRCFWLFLLQARGRLLARCGYIWRCVALGFGQARSRRPCVIGSRMWRCTGLGFALEDFDNDHVAAATWADEPRLFGCGVGCCGVISFFG